MNRAAWTLIDQGAVSLGSFLTNVILAKELPAAEYGTFALLFGAMLVLQIFNGSLIFYPVSVRCAVLREEERARLMGTSTLLTAALCIPICLILVGGVFALRRGDLVPPALLWLVLWQFQEAMRRGLFSTLRHRDALIGDVLNYLGQITALIVLLRFDALTLPNAIYAMAATSGAAGIVQAIQVAPKFRDVLNLRNTVRDFWSIGSWSLAYNLTVISSGQVFSWMLAWTGGPAAVASLQALFNLINIGNPIFIGLSNIIPQIVARERHAGAAEAWHAARLYIWIGIPPLLFFYSAVLIRPDLLLVAVYGPESAYIHLTHPLQILAVAWICGYFAAVVCAYLHGVDEARLALFNSVIGTATAIVVGTPLIATLGLTGGCLTLVLVNIVRAVAAHVILQKMFLRERAPSFS